MLVNNTYKKSGNKRACVCSTRIPQRIYLLVPRSQNIVPNIKAITVVKKILTAVYGGFLQYDKCCFHRHAMHCTMKDWEYCVGK